MTRINTNVLSLNAQKTLGRSNAQLQESLTRLSTGLRINVGKDDPAGLIASEILRSDIVSVQRAISNSERANQMIATADSALGQVSSLLNDVRGLVSESANTGAMSAEQLAANQLQIDSSLDAIDRIAQVTQFQGKRLLDGNMDFVTRGVGNQVSDLQINLANFGTQTEIGIDARVMEMAQRAELNYASNSISAPVVLEVGGANGFEAFSFAADSTVTEMASAINLVSDAIGVRAEVVDQDSGYGSITLSSFGADNDIVLTADEAGHDAGNYRVMYTLNDGAVDPTQTEVDFTAAADSTPGTINVRLGVSEWEAASASFDNSGVANSGLEFTATAAGTAYNDIGFEVVVHILTTDPIAETSAGDVAVAFNHDANNVQITLFVDDDTSDPDFSAADIKAAAEANDEIAALFTVDFTGDDGTGTFKHADVTSAVDGVAFAGGVDGGEVTATANDVVAAINQETDGVLSASLADGSSGEGVVSAFEQFAFYGDAAANNRLQFLAPADSPDIRFVAGAPESELSVALEGQELGYSSTTIQGAGADSSFQIAARNAGSEYDGVAIRFEDGATAGEEYAVWDEQAKTLTIHLDLDTSTLGNVLDAINNDAVVGGIFEATALDGSDTTATVDDGTAALGTTSGGMVDEGTLVVTLATDANGDVTTRAQDLVDLFNAPTAELADLGLGISASLAEGANGTGRLAATTEDIAFATMGVEYVDAQASGTTVAVNGPNARVTFTATTEGAEYDGVEVVFVDGATKGNETFAYDEETKVLTVTIEDGVTTAADVVSSLDDSEYASLFTAAYDEDVADAGEGAITVDDFATLTGGVVAEGDAQGAALLGTTEGSLTFLANEFGSSSFVSVKALSGTFNLTDRDGNVSDRDVGSDVSVRINGIQAIGDGLKTSLSTSTLDMSFSVSPNAGTGDAIDFAITGGGAQFQLGPDVVSNQQARLGIQSINTAKLGGVSGRLFELRSGGTKSLVNDVKGAANVVEEVIVQVTNLRGRMGAFQRTTLETNINSLNDTLEALTEAESAIRDADFAVESARMTRAQILVQSGTSVLSIANQNPQNVLALLR